MLRAGARHSAGPSAVLDAAVRDRDDQQDDDDDQENREDADTYTLTVEAGRAKLVLCPTSDPCKTKWSYGSTRRISASTRSNSGWTLASQSRTLNGSRCWSSRTGRSATRSSTSLGGSTARPVLIGNDIL